MENEHHYKTAQQPLIYSQTIVPPMTSESLSSTISAAISPYTPNLLNTENQDGSVLAVVSQPTLSQSVQPILLPTNAIKNHPLGQTAIQIAPSTYTPSRMSEIPRGVIYALNHYSPFISIPGASGTQQSQTGGDHGNNNNLCPEDVAEVRQMTSAVAATSFHEHARRSEAGKCQSGGQLRLSELSSKLNNIHIPDGFTLVGAKSPMLTGMMLVAAVDKRYLPGEKDTLTTPGFSGNCIGCGATGFRYFTEFSTHINLKLATQPKKQKHLKCYIIKTEGVKWGRGPLIPWKGTETKKRSHPYQNRNPIQLLPNLLDNFPQKFAEYHHKSLSSQVNNQDTTPIPTIITNGEPPMKKSKVLTENETLQPPTITNQSSPEGAVVFVEPKDPIDQLSSDPLKNAKTLDSLESLNRSISTICGVRPVLLLCQEISCKLPNSVNDLIVSDLLVGCFDFPDTLYHGKTETETVYQYCNSVVSTDLVATESSTVEDDSREHTAANTLINMGGVNTPKPANKVLLGDKSWPSVTDHLKEASTTTLPLNAAIILFTQYLCSLDDRCLNKEQIELLLNKARIEMSTSTLTSLFSAEQTVASTRTQLSLMINLQCSASNGRVRVMTSNISFQNALYKALQWLSETFYISKVANKKMHTPNFVIILSTPPANPIEFGVLVTGVSHAKILAECLGLDSIVCSNFEESIKKLQNQFSQTDSALTRLLKMYEESQGHKVHTPFDAYSGMRIETEDVKLQEPKFAPISAQPFQSKGIFSNQAAMAHQLLKQLRNVAENPDVLDLASFLHVDIRIVVPPTDSLYHMTVKRLCESGILHYLGLENGDIVQNHEIGEKYVITYSDWSESIRKWKTFVQNTQSNPDTLHILIFDQAQRYSLPQGMPDVLPNLKEVFESVNVIPVFVTSVPYMFQTNRSFIDPDNEIYWTDTQQGSAFSKYIDDERVIISDQDMLYFGVKELCDSTRWNQQYALIRSEETFDSALPKANRLNDINYSIVQGYVLLRLYQASLMVSGGIKPAEPYAVMSFITMVTDIVESPLRNCDGSGSMLMIRIPNKQLGKCFYDVLLKTRNSLGMQYRFDVVFDDGERELEIGDYFLDRMRLWKQKSGWDESFVKDWKPKCLEELLDLPCFLILSGEERAGETFPRSLKYVDFNIINHSNFHRSTIEAEIGSCACYLNTSSRHAEPVLNNVRTSAGTTYFDPIMNKDDSSDGLDAYSRYIDNEKCEGCLSKDIAQQHNDSQTHFSSKYPLPIIIMSKPLWLMLNIEQGGTRGLVHLNSDPNTRWLRSNRPLLMTTKPDRMSRYYRRWTEPRPARKVLTTPAAPSTPPSPENDDNQSHSEMEKILASPAKRTRERTRCQSEQIDHDDKDIEDSDKEQYHPRCFLFSGPPQAGKTGSYLYFAYLLHRMLLRLKRVDVYDNCITYTPSTYSSPVEDLSSWKFVSNFLDMRRDKFSPVHVCQRKCEVYNPVVGSLREEGPGTSDKALVILAKTALYDTFHHCDVCKFYREGIANTVAQVFNYPINNIGEKKKTINLQVVIPPIHLKYFDVDEASKTVIRLIIAPSYEDTKHNLSNPSASSPSVKSPIFMMSTMGEEEGLLNLFHGMEETDHEHITFIRSSELYKYQKQWPNHIFAALPDQYDKASDSAVKNVMKCFASQNYNSNEAHRAAKEEGTKTWPFVLFVPDNLVMWQKYWKEPTCYSSDSEEETHDKKERHSNGSVRDSITRDTASLLEFLLAVESNTSLLKHVLIGVRPWSSLQDESGIPCCVRTFIDNCFLLDVSKTQNVQFSPHVYCGENIDFHLKMLDEDLSTCRYEHFTFMCKVTLHSKWTANDAFMLGMESLSKEDIISRLVVQPDKEKMKVIDASPHQVFQKYLKYAGTRLFALGVDEPEHPVLIVGGYLNLGKHIGVCVINNGDIKEKILQSECTKSKKYSGLILYNCSKKLTKECFTNIKFVKNAQLVFVCQERFELRNEALRLDLEEDWRFRLRDEYQTATRSQDGQKTLYFLTGSYTS